MNEKFARSVEFLKRRRCVMSWISLVLYLFYDTFMVYDGGEQFRHLKHILGTGLCISRATATVLNISCALVLFPVCKKLHRLLYHALATISPRLFFFWLEMSKSCHMTLATTIVILSVIHSAAHFINLWNFSRHYDERYKELNFASYKNQNVLELLMTQPGLTGLAMLLIIILMAFSSLRVVRRSNYNFFRYTHQLFILFMALLLIHPLSGVLKEEVINGDTVTSTYSRASADNSTNSARPVFVPIQSKTWLWISFPMLCCLLDMLWRLCSRNQCNVALLQVEQLPGRAISLCLSSPKRNFECRPGQYVLLQCPRISHLEWHPFSITQIPSSSRGSFCLLVRVKGDWTEALEKIIEDLKILRTAPEKPIQLLVDGPYSSPLEGMMSCKVALCVAAGVGITPFSSMLAYLLENPRSYYPGRVHLIWIVRYGCELSWLAELATKVLLQLREANRPDRLHLELYITSNRRKPISPIESKTAGLICQIIDVDKGLTTNRLIDTNSNKPSYNEYVSEKAVLLTPNLQRFKKESSSNKTLVASDGTTSADTPSADNSGMKLIKQYPILGCRVRNGRPHWDKMFGYWIHLYPEENLPLYCCGPKKLTSELRRYCNKTNHLSKSKINLIHEGFV